MADLIEIRQSEFVDLDSVGFGIMYVRDEGDAPSVCVATVDFATDAEDKHEVRAGQPFQVGGQVWQVAEVRNPGDPDWVVVLRRIDGGR